MTQATFNVLMASAHKLLRQAYQAQDAMQPVYNAALADHEEFGTPETKETLGYIKAAFSQVGTAVVMAQDNLATVATMGVNVIGDRA